MYRHLIFSILIFLFHKSHSQDLYENLEIEIKKNVDWYAGILIEGHKMPLNDGYEADLYGTSYSINYNHCYCQLVVI